MTEAKAAPLRLGISGLGLAGAFMIRAAVADPRISLCAAADPLPKTREAFARDFGARVYADFDDLCRDPMVEAIYIASPHRFHAEQAIMAMDHGKAVLVEKPLALSLADCDAIVAAADRTGLPLIVGHTHAFDPSIQEMHRQIDCGALGRLGMILAFNYTDFLFRPHAKDEFDPRRGGGIGLNQVTHQIEIVRLLAGGMVRSVRANTGMLDSARPAEGHCMAMLEFENGVAASLTYSGYDFFDSDEFHHWIAEGGTQKENGRHGKTRLDFAARASGEEAAHDHLGYGSRTLPVEQPFQPHFGVVIATCEWGDLRVSPYGVQIYSARDTREIVVPRGNVRPGQGNALDALWWAVREGRPCPFDARWGKATLEVALAVRQSAKEHSEVILKHQVPFRSSAEILESQAS